MRKFYYVRRNDSKHNGTQVEIPAEQLAQTLRVHPTWQVMEETTNEQIDPIVLDTPKQSLLHCPLCGLASQSEHGLKIHKARMHG